MTKACYAIVTVFLLKRQSVNTRVALLLKRQSVNTIFQIRIHCNVNPDPELGVSQGKFVFGSSGKKIKLVKFSKKAATRHLYLQMLWQIQIN